MADNRFKPYRQNQMRLLPLDLSEMIGEDHMVRTVDAVVESLDLSLLKSFYPGGGAPAYDPRMMLKVVLYAYTTGVYSSRKIAEATRSNIHFLWLCGCAPLDHMTVNRFRTDRLREAFADVLSEVVLILASKGLVTLDSYFLDGTKLEANANKYTFAWKKSVEKYRDRLRANVGRLLDEIDGLNDEEDALREGMPEPGDITREDIDEAARRINERLRKQPRNKELERAKKKIEEDYLPRLRRYERDLADMGPRNSLSKTDRDATFMRMKEDPMKNGQVKAGYNIQTGIENQFIIHATVHQRPGDTACMIPHLGSLKRSLGHLPGNIVADAGYGSEENYAYLQKRGVRAFVKYGMFHKEQKPAFRLDPTQPLNWAYSETLDSYTCSGGRVLRFVRERLDVSDLGYESRVRVYQADGCGGCGCAPKCLKPESRKRSIHINPHLAKLRNQARDALASDEGVLFRKRRSTDVETVFGDIKRNWRFTRFSLRGLEKVAHEWRLVAMGHNMRKLARAIKNAGQAPASWISGPHEAAAY